MAMNIMIVDDSPSMQTFLPKVPVYASVPV